MLKRILYGLLTVSLFAPATATAGTVEVWGSTTCQKRFLEPGKEALKAATGVDLDVKGVGTGKGMLALITGKTKIAAASSTLESAVKSARKAAKKGGNGDLDVPDNLLFHEVARDEIVPIVHKDNPVDGLTWDQLAKINTGEITNWKEVGGPDMRIRVVTSHAGSATRGVFQKQVMKKAPFVKGAKEVRSTRMEITEVAKYKGAIGAVSAGFVAANPGKVKTVQTESISRPLGLITLGEPEGQTAELIGFFQSEAGRQYVK